MIICNINEFLTLINSNKKILMSLDIGTKKTGVAFSDPSMKFSIASKVLVAKKNQLIIEIKKLTEEYSLGGLIVGLPINEDGSLNKKCQSIKDITKNLDFLFINNSIELPIFFWDESFSTEAAIEEVNLIVKKRKKQQNIIDKFAAKSILQSFLDYKNKNEI
ncbi:Holliday junction resolvase RuvX [Rickettsiales bacterium]|nr:Holliday junction resolvase RuvX [Rickettsiales bacterium]